ncbi:uncharacterized protein ZSWIM9-like [Ornithodoros turicata]|uniref:uncharacterized protein ZSWIM9-like n=1 Tax=Ornithodoros turicata TaxID=34597 RepID=UPI00313A0272
MPENNGPLGQVSGRNNGKSMKQNCPAKVVVAARRATQELEITKLDTEHNHEISNTIFKSYPECRRLTDEEKEFVLPLMELNVASSIRACKLNERTGNVVIPKDLHNLKQSVQGTNEAEQLMKEIEHIRRNITAKIVPVTDENKQLQIIILFLRTAHMQLALQSFPEVLLLDATYRTNKLKMPLFVFIVQDGCGTSPVVGYAFVASEQYNTVSKLREIFVQENPAVQHTKVVVVDKDFTAISAVRNVFPSMPAIQLCQFHVVKAFRVAASQHAKFVEEREIIMGSFTEMLHAPTSQKYQEAKREFERYANKDAVEYFNKNWDSITEMWVR